MSRKTIAALLLAAASSACGWTVGIPHPPGAETLAIAYPLNDSEIRDLEVELARALSRAALQRLDLRLVAPDEADLVIDGRITDFGRLGGIRSPDNELLEVRDGIWVDLRLVDGETGLELASASRALASGFVVPPDSATTNAPQERPARQRVARNLAEGLILELFDPSAYDSGSSPTGSTTEEN
ncbi:MAG: LPS assembly lipoprotein LptE [Planctomycetota bacterium]|jgi:hypothetical protein